jgi:LysR family glycine cleavage system transcriptional activator
MSLRDLRLLPLNAFRVFLAVMQQRSFRRAADTLSVTPQAVSQQIKVLEDRLAIPLFDRRARTVEPTEDAVLLASYIQSGFDEFSEGMKRVTKSGHRKRINLNVSPYFATHYLINRLGQFRDKLPAVDIRITTMTELPDFVRDEVDVAIQWGFGHWKEKEYEQTLLVLDPKVPCCISALAKRIKEPADLLKLTLLHPLPINQNQLWVRVLRHLGVEVTELTNIIQMHDAASQRQGAVSGLGVALLSLTDAVEDIRHGRLVAPFGVQALRGMRRSEIPGFYLIIPPAHRRVPSVSAFRDWAISESWSVPDDSAGNP